MLWCFLFAHRPKDNMTRIRILDLRLQVAASMSDRLYGKQIGEKIIWKGLIRCYF